MPRTLAALHDLDAAEMRLDTRTEADADVSLALLAAADHAEADVARAFADETRAVNPNHAQTLKAARHFVATTDGRRWIRQMAEAA